MIVSRAAFAVLLLSWALRLVIRLSLIRIMLFKEHFTDGLLNTSGGNVRWKCDTNMLSGKFSTNPHNLLRTVRSLRLFSFDEDVADSCRVAQIRRGDRNRAPVRPEYVEQWQP